MKIRRKLGKSLRNIMKRWVEDYAENWSRFKDINITTMRRFCVVGTIVVVLWSAIKIYLMIVSLQAEFGT